MTIGTASKTSTLPCPFHGQSPPTCSGGSLTWPPPAEAHPLPARRRWRRRGPCRGRPQVSAGGGAATPSRDRHVGADEELSASSPGARGRPGACGASDRADHRGRRAGFRRPRRGDRASRGRADAVVHGHVGDEELEILHTEASATVFASWEEGFGLPVLESLWHGLPCLCHEGSAMAELVPGGGVLAVDMLDEKAIEQALFRLADEDGLLEQLGREAVARPIRTWDEYADDLLGALAQPARHQAGRFRHRTAAAASHLCDHDIQPGALAASQPAAAHRGSSALAGCRRGGRLR